MIVDKSEIKEFLTILGGIVWLVIAGLLMAVSFPFLLHKLHTYMLP